MDAPGTVLALVLAQMAVGGLVLLWAAPTWGAVRHGYEILLGSTLALMALGAWAAIRGPLALVAAAGGDGVTPAVWVGRGLGATTILAALSVLALVVRAPDAGRLLGIVAALAGVASFVPVAALRALRDLPGGLPQGIAELLLGALFLGAVWNGLVLGHWYLVERRLSSRYMEWMARVNVAAVAAGLASVLLSARNPVPCEGLAGRELERCVLQFSPLLSIGGLTIMIGIGVVVLVGIVAAFNWRLASEGGRSIQAATGMFYLAVILAPAAEFAAKVRYF